jgi:hypothetical protein
LSAPIHITLTIEEGLLIGTMIEAAIEQYDNSSIEEQSDPDIIRAVAMWRRIRPLLPSIQER